MQSSLYDDGCQDEPEVIKVPKSSPLKEIKLFGQKQKAKGVK